MKIPKPYKVLTIGLTVLVVLFFALKAADYFIERFFVQKLTELIDNRPESLYQYSFDTLDVDLWRGAVALTGVGIQPKESLVDSVNSKTNTMRTYIRTDIKKIELQGIKIIKFLRTGNLELSELRIETPRFNYFYNPEKRDEESMPPLQTIFSATFSSAFLSQLTLTNGEVLLQKVNEEEPDLSIANIELSLTDAFADTSTVKKFALFEYADIAMTSTGIFAKISEEYHVVSDKIWFDVQRKLIRISAFQVRPQFNRETFAARYPYQKNWMAVTVDQMSLGHFDFDRFSYTGEVHIGEVMLENPNLALYKDKTKPLPPFEKKFLPASNLKKIPWPITVDTTIVKGGTVTINEKSKMRAEITDLTFNQIEATVSGFSNNPRVQRTDQHLIVKATGRPMNAVHSMLNMDFDLESKTDEFTATGSMDAFEAASFNKVFGPGLGIRFLSGEMEDVKFQFNGTDTHSNGTIDLKYSDIKIEVLKSEELEKSGFLSVLANTLIKSNNTPEKPNYTQGIINSPRDQSKGLFPFIWHSLRSGLISTFVPFQDSNNPNKSKDKK